MQIYGVGGMNKMNKEKTIDNLYEAVDMEVTIRCDNCGKYESIFGSDDWVAADIFYEKGWRSGRSSIYCPNCSKRKLKRG